jgi:class 3 adenylate cyclase
VNGLAGRVPRSAVGAWLAFYAVPVGMFTFLFTDIEGSTALLGRVGRGVYARVLADHHVIIRSGLAAHGGREVDTQGNAFFAVRTSCDPQGWPASLLRQLTPKAFAP